MFSHYRKVASIFVASIVCGSNFLHAFSNIETKLDQPERKVIRIAADPNNLPFSNREQEGFENKIALLIAQDLNADIEYVWRAQRRGFFRETLKEGDVDLVMGVPHNFERARTTIPYYRSSYILVYRSDTAFRIGSIDDPILRYLKIGVQVIGDDGCNTPPVHALNERGIDKLVGFTLYGDYGQPNPPARILDALKERSIDVAMAWGPLVGYFVKKQNLPFELLPLELKNQESEHSEVIPMDFEISMGVRKSDDALQMQLNEIIRRRQVQINGILQEFGIPTLPLNQELHTSDPS